jgi:hypothetical protein
MAQISPPVTVLLIFSGGSRPAAPTKLSGPDAAVFPARTRPAKLFREVGGSFFFAGDENTAPAAERGKKFIRAVSSAVGIVSPDKPEGHELEKVQPAGGS